MGQSNDDFLSTEEKEPESGADNPSPKESRSVLISDRDGSEVSDEEEPPFPREEKEPGSGEDTPRLAAGTRQQDLIFDVGMLAAPQEPAQQEEGVDLLGLHSEGDSGPTAPLQACRVPSSNTDLLSCLLVPSDAVQVGPPGDLLGGEAPLLLASPVSLFGVQSTLQKRVPDTGMHFSYAEKWLYSNKQRFTIPAV